MKNKTIKLSHGAGTGLLATITGFLYGLWCWRINGLQTFCEDGVEIKTPEIEKVVAIALAITYNTVGRASLALDYLIKMCFFGDNRRQHCHL